MTRSIAFFAGGALAGVIVALVLGREIPVAPTETPEVSRDIVDVPVMSTDAAEQHREEQYTKLADIQGVLALPSRFARTEALYVLAGRSDSSRIQNLIFEANRVADDAERGAMLEVLFSRLAEADPKSALALARTGTFRTNRSIEEAVWRAWAHKHLDDALFAAKSLTTTAQQQSAGQALLAAFGYLGNDTTDRIQEELGIEPDRQTLMNYMFQLANRSPADAIAYLDSVEDDLNKRLLLSQLVNYYAYEDPQTALAYADLFEDKSSADYFRSLVNREAARANPEATLARFLTGGVDQDDYSELWSASAELAKNDLGLAMQYYDQVNNEQARMYIGSAVVRELAKDDPTAALAWAREHESIDWPRLQMAALEAIAEEDPQLAIAEALKSSNRRYRSGLVSTVVQRIAHEDPARAITYLDGIENLQDRRSVIHSISETWMRKDPDAAVTWLLTQDESIVGHIAENTFRDLVRTNLNAAMRLLPRLDEAQQRPLRHQIVTRLAAGRSPADAQAFIQQFEGQPGFDELQASIVSGIAHQNIYEAKNFADQLPDGAGRDSAYAHLIQTRANVDPREAASWLANISDDGQRSKATSYLASQWYASEPGAATRWVESMPRGDSRDESIMQMARHQALESTNIDELINSIDDQGKRSTAKFNRIYAVYPSDPQRAAEMLDDEDITAEQRQQFEERQAANPYRTW